jgi:hypothetical protein
LTDASASLDGLVAALARERAGQEGRAIAAEAAHAAAEAALHDERKAGEDARAATAARAAQHEEDLRSAVPPPPEGWACARRLYSWGVALDLRRHRALWEVVAREVSRLETTVQVAAAALPSASAGTSLPPPPYSPTDPALAAAVAPLVRAIDHAASALANADRSLAAAHMYGVPTGETCSSRQNKLKRVRRVVVQSPSRAAGRRPGRPGCRCRTDGRL